MHNSAVAQLHTNGGSDLQSTHTPVLDSLHTVKMARANAISSLCSVGVPSRGAHTDANCTAGSTALMLHQHYPRRRTSRTAVTFLVADL